ncbi:hypothetical protein TNIN_313021 [Trichonephila inaurata madagascariensis]|uniref:Uncharacterized protein n=1 Tax=Trichonephila inaurata madagascariensis TaxID=2747483 RepID=A0A8X7CKG9_9ARAC|nr:hypothetical protein TNIN_313021 [Trichonephila inaurata madagascariensis]
MPVLLQKGVSHFGILKINSLSLERNAVQSHKRVSGTAFGGRSSHSIAGQLFHFSTGLLLKRPYLYPLLMDSFPEKKFYVPFKPSGKGESLKPL